MPNFKEFIKEFDAQHNKGSIDGKVPLEAHDPTMEPADAALQLSLAAVSYYTKRNEDMLEAYHVWLVNHLKASGVEIKN